jgi:glycosyltransferase involved in cell wall biosynthesis
MNAGLRVAKGKYVKELDADDWFDTKEFERFIEQLKNVDCDLVITNSTENYSSGKKEKRVYSSNKDNRIYDFSIMSSLKFCRLDMQATSYRTELLREINYQQTEGIFYTDQEWCFYPMFFVNSIAFINANVYQYFIGRPGQTVDRAVWFKHNHHRLIIVKRLLSYYTSFIIDNALPEEKRKYVLFIMNHIIISLYRCYLFLLPKENFNVKDLQKFDNDIKEIQDLIQFNIYSVRIHKLIPFPLLWYWRKFSKRMPQGIIRFLFILKKLKRRL